MYNCCILNTIINMHIYTYTCRIHIDTIIKISKDFFKKNIPLTLSKGFCVRGSWRLNKDSNILTSPAPPEIAVCRSRSPGLLNRRPGGPLRWVLFSLPHLVSNSSDLQLTDFLSSPSYIIVQSPTQYLWNGMFDRHQAEITVIQFRGHPLPVHQFLTVLWDFNPVPYYQPFSPMQSLVRVGDQYTT